MATPKVNISVFESLKDSQMQHGLKYENYRSYRVYCSRRLHRIRRSLNVYQGVSNSAKARHQRGRRLMDISNAMVIEAGQDYGERMLLIPLILSERAWAYAMQLKQEISEHPRRRFHLFRRFEKASEHARRFERLCNDPESPCTEITKQEATAYASYITGLYNVERESWVEAKENLNKAIFLYLKLSILEKKDEVLEQYRQRIDELRANLRYCAFSLGDQDAKKSVKVELPGTLQFHDLAYKHVKQVEQENTPAKKTETGKEKLDEKDKTVESQKILFANEAIDEEDDEFEETREGTDDDTENEDQDDDEDDDKKQSGSRAGGVTGLVKGWLGGAWS